jgi:class 3 adenylate cyclase/CHASE2 domain-containing sensor protein
LCGSGFFALLPAVKFKPFKRIPLLVACGVIVLVCLARWFRLGEGLERETFDLRAQGALHFPSPVATNLGFVYIDEQSVRRVWNGSLGFSFGLYWPRQIYARLVQELAEQGANVVAFDVLFGELRPDHAPVKMADGSLTNSDDFFAFEMRRAGNVIIAITPEITPPLLFATNALALGDITTEKDPDGVLRRARAFRVYRKWHNAFRQLEDDPEYGVDLRLARVEPGRIVLPRAPVEHIVIPLDHDGNFDLADFGGEKLPEGMARKARPFTEQRIWHLGIVLAAKALNLDLSKAEVDLQRGRITLRNPAGLERVIPVDADGYLLIDWSIPEKSAQLTREGIHDLLAQYNLRLQTTNALPNRWRDKAVMVGSSGVVGNNLTDRGATPLHPDTLLVSKHWNVANSLITGRFVQRSPLVVDLVVIVLLGLAAALLTWHLPALWASGLVVLTLLAYTFLAVIAYFQSRYWFPLVLPLGGAVLTQHVCLMTWRLVFENAEQRRIRSIFSTLVSPKIVQEVLHTETLALGGTRREVTVLFADVRGFTEFTDASQERVAEFVRQNRLSGPAAEACFDEQARQTLGTINTYLGLVADTVLQNDGLLDKFIGDCVMAFWGYPALNPRHASSCVRAAIEAQRSIYELNRQRVAENARRLEAGPAAQPLLPILFLGTGINTGLATAGLMGSAAKTVVRQANYTVFGGEVNLASRLEAASGHGRIFIGETTYQHLRRDDPALAATCVALPPQKLKGFSTVVPAFEVPWRPASAPPLDEEFPARALSAVPDPIYGFRVPKEA